MTFYSNKFFAACITFAGGGQNFFMMFLTKKIYVGFWTLYPGPESKHLYLVKRLHALRIRNEITWPFPSISLRIFIPLKGVLN